MNIKHICLAAAACASLLAQGSVADLARDFANPPQQARPRVWWHWMNGNITKDGIRKDLEWMHRAGIGGFTVIDAGMATPQVVPQRLQFMTPEWRDAMAFALHLADSLGLEVSIPASPGWSLMGGPWVPPSDAMKKLVWRTSTVTGNGRTQTISLPDPYSVSGPYQNRRIEPNILLGEVIPDDLPSYYQDIKVLAIPVPADAMELSDMEPSLSTPSGSSLSPDMILDGDINTALQVPIDSVTGKAVLDISLAHPQTLCALSFADGHMRGEFDAVPASVSSHLYFLNPQGQWQLLFDIPQGGAPLQTLSFHPVKARQLRLTLDKPAPDYAAMMMGILQPDLTSLPLYELNIFTSPRGNHSEEKAGFMATHDVALFPTPPATGIDTTQVIDLTDRIRPDGSLRWKAPKGKWQIIRLGYSLTGRRNHPASPEATGLEVDKLDPRAWDRYFDIYLHMYQQIPGSNAIKYLLTDSYESGATNWTPRMLDEFRARRGYDLLPWLPALTGQIIQNAEATDKFLADWRLTIAELYAANYDHLSEILHRHGLKGRYTESHEHGRLMLADGMDVKRTAAVPMAAFWARSADMEPVNDPMAAADIRESASVANIYGQPVVAAESFTTVGYPNNAWTFAPEALKPYADFAFANGLNQVVVHCSPHQPVDSLRPGLSLSAVGQWFDRQDTWADVAARPWTDYLARTSFLLQQGHNVADILLLYPHDSNISALYGHQAPSIPEGYEFDYASPIAATNAVGYPVRTSDPAAIPQLIQTAALTPDVTLSSSASVPPRWRHRALTDGTQIYWLNNPANTPAVISASFRHATPYPYLFNPENGQIYALETTDSLTFEPQQSLFVVFATDGDYKAPKLPQALLATEEVKINGPWRLSFDGVAAPDPVALDSLVSLTVLDDPLAKYFSGTTLYDADFRLDSIPAHGLTLSLGDVKNIAQVIVNGHQVATLWKAPFLTSIPASTLLKGTNSLQIKVTNLWANRLIGDAIPGAQPHTFTSMPYYFPGSQPLPAGLLGPVSLSR